MSRRFAWLKRVLKVCEDDHSSIFPPIWNVSEMLVERFCLETRKDFSDMLMRQESNINVKEMVQAMQTTIEFEAQLDKKYSHGDKPGSDQPSLGKFHKFISSCFEPYLDAYIKSEEANIAQLLDGYRNQFLQNEEDSVLPSVVDLFYYLRQSMFFLATLSTGKAFLNYSRMVSRSLKCYAEMLINKYPRDDKKAYTDEELRMICLVINTADYCWTTIPQVSTLSVTLCLYLV